MDIEKILVADDDELSREYLTTMLSRGGFDVTVVEDGDQAAKAVEDDQFDMVFTDMKMPGLTGIELLQRIKQRHPETLVTLMTAYGTVESAVEAMKRGAHDYILKPFSPDQLDLLLLRAKERLNLINENRYLRSEVSREWRCEELVGDHPTMQRVYEMIGKVANSKAPVLIQGESGTGKELVARSIHMNSTRRSRAFIRVNCAALTETLLESELFGHEKGAFTGATARREGRFELADGGTMLLDEVSEIPLKLQAKLLRVLEEEEFERVGGTRTIRVDVRVLATTNRDVQEAIRNGEFREDLYYRLAVVPIVLPPLRERPSDIPALVKSFSEKFHQEEGLAMPTLSGGALDLLQGHSWPGNVRELRNIVHRAMVMGQGEALRPEHLRQQLLHMGRQPDAGPVGKSIEQVERDLILRTLDETDGNKTAAAKILKVTARTLRNKLQRYRCSTVSTREATDAVR